jgi:hypothetical protein
MPIPGIVIYGVGSTLVVEIEEACARAGVPIVAGVRNMPGPVYSSDDVAIVDSAAVDAQLRACAFVVPLFTPGHRKAAVLDAHAHGFTVGATLVHPTASVARSTQLGEGVFVNAGAVIGAASRLGAWVLVNRSASIAHHVELADYVSIGPAAVVCGHAVIGRGAMIGAGSLVMPGVSVGANAVVSAGSLVREVVPPDSRCEGRPAVVVETGIAGYHGVRV